MRPRFPSRGRPRRTALALALTTLLSLLGLGAATQHAAAAETLISQSRPVTASSIESANFPAGAVVDGDPATRWASTWTDPAWIRIDLGTGATVSRGAGLGGRLRRRLPAADLR
ncbi:discoidin domain-containing protein [Peterkaempfera sp. SMS 1(5)a]|uniref:discoidin domain-containing protein n=1 Tax=Peterkaempfera podocarpi TaxID=3232308 RepID=UPI00367360AC